MKKYKVAIWEEVSGFIDVKAESKGKAEEIAEELMNSHGVETLFYPPKEAQFTHDEDLTQYNGKHTHGNREVLDISEIS